METQTPRRAYSQNLTPAEKAIDNAIGEIEKLGADVTLTNIVGELTNTKNKLSDFIDGAKSKVQTPTVGRIVHFYPGHGDGAYKLPNGMDFAPAIVSQVCSEEHINLTVFVMARPDHRLPYPSINAWSICNLELLNPANFLPDSHPAYWVYPPKV